MELVAIFTRRDPAIITPMTNGAVVDRADNVLSYADKIDVMILCGGSATDLPVQTPALAEHFCVCLTASYVLLVHTAVKAD